MVESFVDLERAHRLHARGGELDRQGDAVEPPADVGDRGDAGVVELQLRSYRAGAVEEQPDRFGLRHRRDGHVGGGHPQRTYGEDLLAGRAESLPARRQDREFGTRAHEHLDDACRLLEHVLAVVDDEERLVMAQPVGQHLVRGGSPGVDPERVGDRADHTVG